jgi:hypothetical protein
MSFQQNFVQLNQRIRMFALDVKDIGENHQWTDMHAVSVEAAIRRILEDVRVIYMDIKSADDLQQGLINSMYGCLLKLMRAMLKKTIHLFLGTKWFVRLTQEFVKIAQHAVSEKVYVHALVRMFAQDVATVYAMYYVPRHYRTVTPDFDEDDLQRRQERRKQLAYCDIVRKSFDVDWIRKSAQMFDPDMLADVISSGFCYGVPELAQLGDFKEFILYESGIVPEFGDHRPMVAELIANVLRGEQIAITKDGAHKMGLLMLIDACATFNPMTDGYVVTSHEEDWGIGEGEEVEGKESDGMTGPHAPPALWDTCTDADLYADPPPKIDVDAMDTDTKNIMLVDGATEDVYANLTKAAVLLSKRYKYAQFREQAKKLYNNTKDPVLIGNAAAYDVDRQGLVRYGAADYYHPDERVDYHVCDNPYICGCLHVRFHPFRRRQENRPAVPVSSRNFIANVRVVMSRMFNAEILEYDMKLMQMFVQTVFDRVSAGDRVHLCVSFANLFIMAMQGMWFDYRGGDSRMIDDMSMVTTLLRCVESVAESVETLEQLYNAVYWEHNFAAAWKEARARYNIIMHDRAARIDAFAETFEKSLANHCLLERRLVRYVAEFV